MTEGPGAAVAGLALETFRAPDHQLEPAACFHCGEPCRDSSWTAREKVFCCQGCLVVHDLLAENGLDQFYGLSPHPGVRIGERQAGTRWAGLDDPAVQARLIDFTDGKTTRVTFRIPAIHCVACVWLLENLYRLNPAIGKSQVNFPRREVSISFRSAELKLSEVAVLLASIGYEPSLTLGELEKKAQDNSRRKRWLQVGIAGFAFGNIMLMSVPAYLGLDSLSGPTFKALFGYLSLLLALPVLIYSASDYWWSALLSFRQRVLTLDVPISLGLIALYAQSAYEILSGIGEGYLDSMAGLIFFLLCGRVFQQKTHDRIVFDRDYKSFFPLSVTRWSEAGEESVAISNLRVGDRLVLRNRELIPADARLVGGEACIDYSFVTGESEVVRRSAGDHLYAGGQQVGGVIEVETIKPVSQSYLTSLWSHEAFQKQRDHDLNSLTNRYSRRFTKLVVAIALGAALFWVLSGDVDRGVKAFTSVLIVACPCALALAAPFTLGTAQRLLARAQVFLKNGLVLERIAECDTIVFDKTGTLTAGRAEPVRFVEIRKDEGSDDSGPAKGAVESLSLGYSLCRLSTHPVAIRISEDFMKTARSLPVKDFVEVPGRGLLGRVEGREVRLGSRAWLVESGLALPSADPGQGGVSWLAVEGKVVGGFFWGSGLRPDADRLLRELGGKYELALLSGDNERERAVFAGLFASAAPMRFNQSPLEKLEFIRGLQEGGKTVMMVGDGLNDAGALKQSHVGTAVVEKTGAFSPGSDVIMSAARVPDLAKVLALARNSVRVVRWGFVISALYNAVGVSIAAAGILSPLICAVLMPISSLTVVLFASGATGWASRKAGLS